MVSTAIFQRKHFGVNGNNLSRRKASVRFRRPMVRQVMKHVALKRCTTATKWPEAKIFF